MTDHSAAFPVAGVCHHLQSHWVRTILWGRYPRGAPFWGWRLFFIYLEFNLFEGSVLDEMCESADGRYLVADCLDDIVGFNTTALASNVCAEGCCSFCYNRVTGQCGGVLPSPPGYFIEPAVCLGPEVVFEQGRLIPR